ncbi:dockerin type I repeat-containing protein [Desulfonema magnum]|uniref:Integrine FG-GAP repeat-containing protein n=1 Tax=Desulfonema magnum TaxID=45655 RepID=A0A975BK04_9BACT|nr:dockerin type I repeat-containing protein [Desulfonema magnum]QTA86672.1 Integrine FG-GAP repeat-containing protein [Desulfonema magnum]
MLKKTNVINHLIGNRRTGAIEVYAILSLVFFFGFVTTSFAQTLTDLESVDPDVFISTEGLQGSNLGYAMVKGDFNGDSVDDVAVSAAGEPNPFSGDPCGMVMIFYGGSDMSNLPASFNTGNQTEHHADVRLFGVTDGAKTGSKLAAGELNGDNIDDLLIVEQNATDTSASQVYVVFGSQNLNATYQLEKDADLVLKRDNDEMWISAIIVEDVTGDNQEDLLIADICALETGWTPLVTTHLHPTDSQKGINGGVYVVKGPLSAGGPINLVTDADIYILKNEGDDRFQVTSLAVGDIDGDAQAELLMGHQYETNPTSSENAGAVFMQAVGADFAASGKVVDIAPGGELACKVIYGGWKEDQLGGPFHNITEVTPLTGRGSIAIGDVNGDQINDIIIGSPMSKIDGTKTTGTGKVEVVFGQASFPQVTELHSMRDNADIRITLDTSRPDTKLGFAVSAEDVNDDGIADITMSAPQARAQTAYNGYLYTVFGKSSLSSEYDLATTYDIAFITPDPPHNYSSGRMGSSFLIGEFNNGGSKDFILGAPKGSTSTTGWVGIFWDQYCMPGNGDIDGNGVSLTDAVLALQIIAGMVPTGLPDNYLIAADVNCDGKIGMAEVLAILGSL